MYNFNSRLNQAEIANFDIHEKQMNRGGDHGIVVIR